MTSDVTINELTNLPHFDGQTVLHAVREDFEIEVRYDGRCDGGRYWIYAFAIQPKGGVWTRLAAERRTPQQARDLAARAWTEGRDFDTSIG
jgi:hypothetical protein